MVQTQQAQDNTIESNGKPLFSQFGSRNMNRARTSHFGQRNMTFKQIEKERKEIEEIQEAMREMEALGTSLQPLTHHRHQDRKSRKRQDLKNRIPKDHPHRRPQKTRICLNPHNSSKSFNHFYP